MRNMLLALWALMWTSVFATAQEAEALAADGVTDTLESALLWEVSGDGIYTSYVFGTIHLIPAEDYFLPEATKEALDISERVVFEIDMAEMMDMGAQMALLTKAFMSDGKTLRDLVSEEDYAIVEAHFEEMGLPLFLLERIKPMFLSVFASGDFSMDGMAMGSTKSYEMEFYEMAQAGEKTTGGLETMEFQISMFDSIPYDDQAQMLVESIKQQDSGSDQLDELVDMYKSQDIDALFNMLAAGDESIGEHEDVLVSGRNRNWIPIMGEMMQKETVFFAVGAGHLGGENGVIRLLRDAGYTVEALREAPSKTKRTKQRF